MQKVLEKISGPIASRANPAAENILRFLIEIPRKVDLHWKIWYTETNLPLVEKERRTSDETIHQVLDCRPAGTAYGGQYDSMR
jgi:hypothetical protein